MFVEASSYFAQKSYRRKNEKTAQSAIAANSAIGHASACARVTPARLMAGW